MTSSPQPGASAAVREAAAPVPAPTEPSAGEPSAQAQAALEQAAPEQAVPEPPGPASTGPSAVAALPPRAGSGSHSIWHTLRHPVFRGMWFASAAYFIGNAMQGMAAAWFIVERTGSTFLAAAVQTAVFLPMFVLALPAGVLADTTDRRRLLLGTLYTQAVAVALLAVLVLADWAGPATILFFTALAGCCTAMLSPAWNSAVGEILPREELPQAIVAMSIAYNAARALGPAMAGVVFAWAGGGWVFGLALAGTLSLALALRRWPPRPHPPSRLPAERLWGGTLAGLRYARHSHTILAQLVRTAAYSAAGSALWALLPVIGQQRLGLGAEGFGLLMGCLGAGAVSVGLVIGRVRARLGLERLVMIACLVFAAVMLVAAWSRWRLPVYASLVAGGAAWMAVMSTFNTATQTSAPPWVRSRATALHVLSALGSFAIGSFFWGIVAGVAGLQLALCLATVLMLGGLLLAKPFPLRMGEAQDVTQAQPVPFENLLAGAEPAPEAGPVAVEYGYRIREADTAAFLDTIALLRAPRQRDGATFWRVYKDLGDSSRYVERFIVTSWADYLHQRARATLADQALEAQVRAFLQEGESVTTQHYIAER